jgi:hypothetical protein
MTPPIFPDALEKILQYTAIVAKALQDVAATTQIPFLDTICTVVLTMTPLMEVCSCNAELPVSSQFNCRISNFKKTDASA